MDSTRPRRPLTYYHRVRIGDTKSPHTGKTYPNHIKECSYCGGEFTVYRLPRSTWPRIDCCCPGCYWMSKLNRPYIESMSDFFEFTGVERPIKRGEQTLATQRENAIRLATLLYDKFMYLHRRNDYSQAKD